MLQFLDSSDLPSGSEPERRADVSFRGNVSQMIDTSGVSRFVHSMLFDSMLTYLMT